MKRLMLQRQTRVCNVCWWETDATNGNVTIFPEGRSPKDVNLKVSSTNIHNIKSYVKTNLQSFKEPGGCVLLLETILCCHGPYTSLYANLWCDCMTYNWGDALVDNLMGNLADLTSSPSMYLLYMGGEYGWLRRKVERLVRAQKEEERFMIENGSGSDTIAGALSSGGHTYHC